MNVLVMNCSPVRNGATAEIQNTIAAALKDRDTVRTCCIADYDIGFCKGCRTCHKTARCVLRDALIR